MWFETQNCAMMGVQVTAGKRKLETAATAGGDLSPAKNGRWEPPAGGGGGAIPSTGPTTDDCIARLQAVAVPVDAWRPTPTATPPPNAMLTTSSSNSERTSSIPSLTTTATTTSSTPLPPPTPGPNGGPLATTLLADDFDDDDDFEDELSDDDRCSGAPDSLRYHQTTPQQQQTQQQQQSSLTTSYEYQQPSAPQTPPPHHNNHHHSNQQQQQTPQRNGYNNSWHYYAPPVQQKILCEENGKSYLELGAAPIPPPVNRTRCCDGRTRWCNVPCYRQRRLAVLNLSMCKLARYRQCSDPSLRRSVLICNTLRHIEREMEAEGQQPSCPPPPPPPEPCYSPSAAFTECTPLTPVTPQAQRLTPIQPVDAYEHNLRDFAPSSGRATPFPSSSATADTDSGIGDEDSGRTINWGSVLSLTSQTDLEPLNNNEFYAELGLTNSSDFLNQEWKEQRNDGEWDSFMHVLVGGS